MIVLGIETSCDETSAALVTQDRQILSTVTHSQISDHVPYGGVVPELGARAHLSYLETVITTCCEKASLSLSDIDAIAVTAGPGLIGGVMVGTMVAKTMAATLQKPIIAVNHLEGHALTARLSHNIDFPYLLLLISGGHCQFLDVLGVGKYVLLGETIDDAAGEAFDKVARCLGLSYPGGPALEQMAKAGNPHRFSFPRPLFKREGCDLSFSGLKTAVRIHIEKMSNPTEQDKADIAASFQQALTDCLLDRLRNALKMTTINPTAFVLGGGVAANLTLRNQLAKMSLSHGLPLIAPPLWLCTDNAAMIAWAGIEKLKKGHVSDLSFSAHPRWPLVN